jgi:hypothetical protein
LRCARQWRTTPGPAGQFPGTADPVENVPGALRRVLHEETALAYVGDVAHACRVSITAVPGDAHMHAVVPVFDAQGDGAGAALGAGLATSPFPRSMSGSSNWCRWSPRLRRLSATPGRVVREPMLACLIGDSAAGWLWCDSASGIGGEPWLVEPD